MDKREEKQGELGKKENGITLIALVVTIIVLLILAGISIAMLTGQNGILNRVGEAKEKTEKQDLDETVKLIAMSAMTDDLGMIKSTETLNKALKTELGEGNYQLTKNEEKEWIVTVEGKSFIVKSNGNILRTNWVEKSDGTIQSTDGTITLHIGDLINYDPTNGGTLTNDAKCKYIAPKGTYVGDTKGQDGAMEFGTGSSADQEFTLDNNTEWRVIGIENGQIMLISKNVLKKVLTLRGQTGYQYGTEIVNNVSKIYGYGEGAVGARAITVEDIDKVTGYHPEKEGKVENEPYEKGAVYEYGNQMTYKNDGSKITYQGSKQPKSESASGQTMFRYYDIATKAWKTLATNESTKCISNFYHYYPQSLTTGDTETVTGISKSSAEYDTLFKFTGNGYYWLGSQFVRTNSGGAGFGLRFVISGTDVYGYGLFGSHGDTNSNTCGVRPVVYLESELQLESSGTANQWKIVK